jgi:hypothetical protein
MRGRIRALAGATGKMLLARSPGFPKWPPRKTEQMVLISAVCPIGGMHEEPRHYLARGPTL